MPDPTVHRDGPLTFGQTRDTAPSLGRDITPPPSCPNCHRLEDRDELMRDHCFRLVRDLAAAERTIRELRARYQPERPTT